MPRTASITPKNYTELFQHYYPYVKRLVFKAGVPDQQVEDVAMTLLTKFYEKGVLEQFDVTREDFNGSTPRFASFLSGFIVSYVRHYAERERIHQDRERQYIDTERVVGENSEWLDWNGYTHEDDLTQIEYDMTVARIREHLATLPVVNKRNFLLLFDLIVMQLEEHNRTYIRELAGLFEVSDSLVSSWLQMLRGHVSQVTM